MNDLRHGIITTYKKGCRCDDCRAAKGVIQKRYVSNNREKVREKGRIQEAKYREKRREKYKEQGFDPVKNRAYANLRYAMKTGRVVKGECEQAGEDCWGEIQAHHDDYSKPLEVRWLCASHHGLLHAQQRAA
jgi:hypothetical protein